MERTTPEVAANTPQEQAYANVENELWDVLQHLKNEVTTEVSMSSVDKQRADDLLYLLSRTGIHYRYHARDDAV